jgi:hypothetical protein
MSGPCQSHIAAVMNLNECCSILTDIDIYITQQRQWKGAIMQQQVALFSRPSAQNNIFLIQYLPVLKLRSIKGLSLEN